MWLYRAAAIAVLSALALGSATGRTDDTSKAPPPPPSGAGLGFLEFLGSVDRLSEVNPDYLSQADPAKARKPPGSGTKPPPPPPPNPAAAKN